MFKNSAIIQARTGSTRLPNKIFMNVGSTPLIERIVNCLEKVENIDSIIIATTENRSDDTLVDWCNARKVKYFRGDEHNVLKRYFDCTIRFPTKNIIRITADDPFKDPQMINKMILQFENAKLDFLCNNNPPTFPEGLDVEIFSMKTLETMHLKASSNFEREHVTQYCHRHINEFKFENYNCVKDYSKYRLTIDTKNDLDFCNEICRNIRGLEIENLPFIEIVNFLNMNPGLVGKYSTKTRSDMYI